MHLTWQQSIGIDESHLIGFVDCLGSKIKIHSAIQEDLTLLLNAASAAGINISIVSAFRSFERQLTIWNAKWLGHKPVYSRHGRLLNVQAMSDIEKYKALCLWSALPGFSRHHWGTDLDIFSADAIQQGHQVELTEAEFSSSGPCAQLESWLTKNLQKYGFFRPYQQYRQGVSAEPWHISHISVATAIFEKFDYPACRTHLNASLIQSAAFIDSQFEHYTQQYFANICEAPK